MPRTDMEERLHRSLEPLMSIEAPPMRRLGQPARRRRPILAAAAVTMAVAGLTAALAIVSRPAAVAPGPRATVPPAAQSPALDPVTFPRWAYTTANGVTVPMSWETGRPQPSLVPPTSAAGPASMPASASPDGSVYIVSSAAGIVAAERPDGSTIAHLPLSPDDEFRWSEDSRMLCVVNAPRDRTGTATIAAVDLSGGRRTLATLGQTSPGGSTSYMIAGCSASTHMAVVATLQNFTVGEQVVPRVVRLRAWSTSDGAQLFDRTLPASTGGVTLSPDGRLIAVYDADRRVSTVSTLADNTDVLSIPDRHIEAFSGDGRWVFCVQPESLPDTSRTAVTTVDIRALSTGRTTWSYTGHYRDFLAAPVGPRFVVASDDSTGSGNLTLTLVDPTSGRATVVTSAAVSMSS